MSRRRPSRPLFAKVFASRKGARVPPRPPRWRPTLEELESRYAPSCTVGIVQTPGGNQLQAIGDNANNTFVLDHSGSTTTLCSQSFADASFSSVLINTGNGTDVVNFVHTIASAPVTVNLGSGQDMVTVGSGSENLVNIQGPVAVHGGGGLDQLTVADQLNLLNQQTYTLSATTLTRTGAAAITYDQIPLLTVNGGPGNNNTYTVTGTADNFLTTLDTNRGVDTVYVQATTGPLAVDAPITPGVTPRTNVGTDGSGNAGTVQGVRGTLTLPNPGDLTVDDSADPTGRAGVRIDDSSIANLAPAAIHYASNGLHSLLIKGGSGSNTFTVAGTPTNAAGVTTTLSTGRGTNTVTVQATRGPLDVVGAGGHDAVTVANADNDLLDLRGALTVTNPTGRTDLVLNDAGDAGSKNASVGAGDVSGLAAVPIMFTLGAPGALTVRGGTGGNNFTVTNTPPGGTTVDSGRGNDAVTVRATTGPLTINGIDGHDAITVGSAGSVQGVRGPVTVTNASGSLDLTVDDSADPADHADVRLSDTALTGLAPGEIHYPADRLDLLTVTGGRGNATYTVTNTPLHTTTLNTGSGVDQVFVQRTAAGFLNVNGAGGGGQDRVVVGLAGSVQSIRGTVTVTNPPSFTDLVVDSSADTAPHAGVSLDDGVLAGLTPAPAEIRFAQANLKALTVKGGSGGNTFTVDNTPSSSFPAATTLVTGRGNDTVFVHRTSGTAVLVINGTGGRDRVTVGNSVDGVQDIREEVDVTNPGGATALAVDDTANPASKTATLDESAIAGLSPAPVRYAAADLSGLTVRGGSGGNTFTVQNTPAVGTALFSGAGNDTVNVRATTGPLDINGQAGFDTVSLGTAMNVQAILGVVTVTSAGGSTALTVDDSTDPGVRTAVLGLSGGLGALRGLAPADIRYALGDLRELTVNGGRGANSFSVLNTPASATTLNAGSGESLDAVTVGNGTLAGILGALTVTASTSFTSLSVNDAADGGARLNVGISDNAITGLAPGTIRYVAGSLSALAVIGGSGGNVFTVLNTPTNSFPLITTLNAAAGDLVNVLQTTGQLNVAGAGTVDVGNNPPAGGGTGVQDIKGVLMVSTAGSLVVDDSSDPQGQRPEISDRAITRLAPKPITYTSLGALTVLGSNLLYNAGNTIDITNTAAGIPTTLYDGSGDNTVNVRATTGPLTIFHAVGLLGADTLRVGNTVNGVFDLLAPVVYAFTLSPGDPPAPPMARLIVDDTPTTVNTTATITATTTDLGPAHIDYRQASLSSVEVHDGKGDDTVTVGNPDNTLDGIPPVSVNGGAGADTLKLNDKGYRGSETYSITPKNVTLAGLPLFEADYQNIEDLTINAGPAGGHTFTGQTAAGTTLNIFGGGGNGNCLMNLGPNVVYNGNAGPDPTLFIGGMDGTGTLNGMGHVTIVDGGNIDLIVNDTDTTSAQTYTITSASITRTGIGLITFADGIQSLALSTGGGNDTVVVQGTPAPTAVTLGAGNDTVSLAETTANTQTAITLGAGNDTVNVGDASGTLDGMQGPVSLTGGPGNDLLNFNDQGTSDPQRYTLTADTLSRQSEAPPITEVPPITFTGFDGVVLNGGSGGTRNLPQQVVVEDTPVGADVTINHGSGVDLVTVDGTAGPVQIVGSGGGALDQVLVTDPPNVLGPLSISNPPSLTQLTVDCLGADAQLGIFDISQGVGEIAGPGPFPIYYEQYNVIDVTLIGGGQVTVSSAGSLTSVPQVVNIEGAGTLTLDDNTANPGKTYTISVGEVTHDSSSQVYYSGVGNLVLNAASASTTTVAGLAGGTTLTLTGGAGGGNTLIGPDAGTIWTIAGTDAGTVDVGGGVTFSAIQNLVGGAGDDTFLFGAGDFLSGSINGGAGTNELDYPDGVQFTWFSPPPPDNPGPYSGIAVPILGGTFQNITTFNPPIQAPQVASGGRSLSNPPLSSGSEVTSPAANGTAPLLPAGPNEDRVPASSAAATLIGGKTGSATQADPVSRVPLPTGAAGGSVTPDADALAVNLA